MTVLAHRGENSDWYSGITKNTTRRIREHITNKNVVHFRAWNTESYEVAHELELFFSTLGFNNSANKGSSDKESINFYVFKSKIDFLEKVDRLFGFTNNEKTPKQVKVSKSKPKNKK